MAWDFYLFIPTYFIHPYILYSIVFESICVKCYTELFMAHYPSHLPRLFVSARNASSRQGCCPRSDGLKKSWLCAISIRSLGSFIVSSLNA